MSDQNSNVSFRAPNRLEVTPLQVNRIIIVGQCLLFPLVSLIQDTLAPGTSVEFVLFNNVAELGEPERPVDEYDFQLIGLPLRAVMVEMAYIRLAYSDTAGATAAFERGCDMIDLTLGQMMKWNVEHNILTFVCNFLVPQSNLNGRLFPRYDLRNPAYAVEKLNEHLAARVATYRNAHLIDIDAIAGSLGRRYVQDDSLTITTHNAVHWDFDFHYDALRLEPPALPASVVFQVQDRQYYSDIWRELCASLRTLRQMDQVKMVITDLDDTLWRGVLAEQEQLVMHETEGWPIGLVEAFMFLRRRGIILAIASKNDETAVQRIFDTLYAYRIHLSDFAIRKINWRTKVENITDILAEANLLPRNVVFIDDNPVERHAVSSAFPDMRVLGADWYSVRRDLLWSAETQVAGITDESERRGVMIEAQAQRETVRKAMSQTDFLASLELRVEVFPISYDTPRFGRAFELLNKSNQFNTTGTRWREEDIARAMAGGMRIVGFIVRDKFTDYGIVGVLLVQDGSIAQFVMSCRVFGLGVEQAVLRLVADQMMEAGVPRLAAAYTETASNGPSRDVYSRSGFTRSETGWQAACGDILAIPPHVQARCEHMKFGVLADA